MKNVLNNTNAKAFTTNPTEWVAVQTYKGDAFITALGNDKAEVREEGYFHWAVMMDYEGNFEVIPGTEINIVNF